MNAERPFSQALWGQTPAAVQDYSRALEARVMAMESAVQRLERTVPQLTEPRRHDSRTSSRPPSSDPPQAIGKRPRREPSGRRPGGPPGHEGQTRALLPVAEGDRISPVKPTQCVHGQQPVQGAEPQPQRPQVAERPPAKPVVTAYPWHRLGCSACGARTRAELPPGVPPGGFGPRVQASASLCTGAYQLSRRTTPSLLEDRCRVSRRLGTLVNVEPATVQAVAAPGAEARRYVHEQPGVHLDATGWREGPPRAWRWTAVTAGVTVFGVRRSRRGKVAQALVGERFWGWLITDRWRGYKWSPTWRRQVCWAHLARDIDAMIARGGRSQEIGEARRDQTRQLFDWGHRVRDGTLAHARLASYRRPVQRAVDRRRAEGQRCGVQTTEGGCREILKRPQALWTFVRHTGVEPTNNTAERAMRPGVLWRKGSFGTQNPAGSRFVDVMMTTVATRKHPHRNVRDYLTMACEATWRADPAPSLLPTPAHLSELLHPAA